MKFCKVASLLYSAFVFSSFSLCVGTESVQEKVGEAVGTSSRKAAEARVIGGGDADPVRYPWFVSLSINNSGFHTCGGMLISPTYVLTAAHCMGYLSPNFIGPPSQIRATLAPYHQANSAYNLPVRSYKIHENWNASTFDFDYALVELSFPIQQPPLAVLDLNGESESFTVAKDIHVIGFGSIDPKFWVPPAILQEGSNKYLPNDICTIWMPASTITKNMLCTVSISNPNRGGCRGDSGGPRFVKSEDLNDKPDLVVGLVSAGPGICGNGPAFAARISRAASWIKEHVPDLPAYPDPPKGKKAKKGKNKNKCGGGKKNKTKKEKATNLRTR